MSNASRALLAVALAAATTPATAKPRLPTATEAILGDLHTAARCADRRSPRRHWCIAADGWATGTPA